MSLSGPPEDLRQQYAAVVSMLEKVLVKNQSLRKEIQRQKKRADKLLPLEQEFAVLKRRFDRIAVDKGREKQTRDMNVLRILDQKEKLIESTERLYDEQIKTRAILSELEEARQDTLDATAEAELHIRELTACQLELKDAREMQNLLRKQLAERDTELAQMRRQLATPAQSTSGPRLDKQIGPEPAISDKYIKEINDLGLRLQQTKDSRDLMKEQLAQCQAQLTEKTDKAETYQAQIQSLEDELRRYRNRIRELTSS